MHFITVQYFACFNFMCYLCGVSAVRLHDKTRSYFMLLSLRFYLIGNINSRVLLRMSALLIIINCVIMVSSLLMLTSSKWDLATSLIVSGRVIG